MGAQQGSRDLMSRKATGLDWRKMLAGPSSLILSLHSREIARGRFGSHKKDQLVLWYGWYCKVIEDQSIILPKTISLAVHQVILLHNQLPSTSIAAPSILMLDIEKGSQAPIRFTAAAYEASISKLIVGKCFNMTSINKNSRQRFSTNSRTPHSHTGTDPAEPNLYTHQRTRSNFRSC